MNRGLRLGVACLVASAALWAQAPVDVRTLTRGQMLTGKTRMADNAMVSFNLKVLSVMAANSPGDDAVLAEILDPLFQETGVLAGMSGSPVYLGEKMVGAVAFTFPMQKKPIVGITPLTSMLRLLRYAQTDRPDPEKESRGRYGIQGMKAISTPIAVSGDFRLDGEMLKDYFHGDAYLFTPGAGSGQGTATNKIFIPGDAIGVNLVRGDLNLSGYGTVTWVSNEWVLAFGHPMDSAGSTCLPVHLAEIDAVVPQLNVSFKVGNLGAEVGALVEDRKPAILARMGKAAPRVPLDVTLQSEIQNKKFHFEIADSRDSVAQFAPLVVANTLMSWESGGEPSTLAFTWHIKTGYKGRVLEVVDVITAPENGPATVALAKSMAQVLGHLSQNRFARIPVLAMDVQVTAQSKAEMIILEDIETDRLRYRPGDTVKATIHHQRWHGSPGTTVVSLVIPANARDGIYPLIASSGNFMLSFDANQNPDKWTPRDPGSLLDILEYRVTSKTLSLWMFGSSDGLRVKGESYNRLPVFQRGVLESSRTVDKAPLLEFQHSEKEAVAPIAGMVMTRIRVEEDRFGK